MSNAAPRACARCGQLVLAPGDPLCPYCDHPNGARVLPLGLQAALRDWPGTLERLRDDPIRSQLVVLVVWAIMALALLQVVPWSQVLLVNAVELVALLLVSLYVARSGLGLLPRLPSPWPWVRGLPGFEGARGPDHPLSVEERVERVRRLLEGWEASLVELEGLRREVAERTPGASGAALVALRRSLDDVDGRIARLERTKMEAEVQAAVIDRWLWELRVRALSASPGARGPGPELGLLAKEGEAARRSLRARLLDAIPAGRALIDAWSALEKDVAAATEHLAQVDIERALAVASGAGRRSLLAEVTRGPRAAQPAPVLDVDAFDTLLARLDDGRVG